MQQNITITLNQQEVAALRQLIDAALRHAGSAAAPAAVHMLAKLEPKAGENVVPMAQAAS